MKTHNTQNLAFDFFKSSKIQKDQRRNELEKIEKFNLSLPAFMVEVDDVNFEMVHGVYVPQGGGSSVRIDRQEQLDWWKEMVKRCYSPSKILFNPTKYGYKPEIISEEFEKREAIHTASMMSWIANGGSLD